MRERQPMGESKRGAPKRPGPKRGDLLDRAPGKPRTAKAQAGKAPKTYKAGWAKPKIKAHPARHRPGSPTGRGKR
jgi:hypothetical protein